MRGSGLRSTQNNGSSNQSALVQQMETGNSEARTRSALISETTTRVSGQRWSSGRKKKQLARGGAIGDRLSELQMRVIWCKGTVSAHLGNDHTRRRSALEQRMAKRTTQRDTLRQRDEWKSTSQGRDRCAGSGRLYNAHIQHWNGGGVLERETLWYNSQS